MKTALQLFDLEPIGVEGHDVGRAILIVVASKVLLQPLEHFLGVVAVKHALVQVGAMTSLVALHVMGVQWDLPNSCTKTRARVSIVDKNRDARHRI